MKSARNLWNTLLATVLIAVLAACGGKKEENKPIESEETLKLREQNAELLERFEELKRKNAKLRGDLKKESEKEKVKLVVETHVDQKASQREFRRDTKGAEKKRMQKRLERTEEKTDLLASVLHSKISQLDVKVEGNQKEIKDVRQWAQQEAQRSLQVKKLTEQRDRLLRTNEQLREVLASKSRVEVQLQKLTSQFAIADQNVKEHLPLIAKLVRQAEELEAEKLRIRDLLNQHLVKNEQEITSAQKMAGDALAAANQAQMDLGALSETVNSVRSQVTQISGKIEEIKTPGELKGVEQQLRNMKAALEKQIAEGDQASSAQISTVETRLAGLLKKVNAVQAAADGSSDLSGFRGEMADLKKDLDSLTTGLSAVNIPNVPVNTVSRPSTQKTKPIAEQKAKSVEKPGAKKEPAPAEKAQASTGSPSDTSRIKSSNTAPEPEPVEVASQDEELAEEETTSAPPTADLKGQLGASNQDVVDFLSNKRSGSKDEDETQDNIRAANKQLVDGLMSELEKIKEAIAMKKGSLKELRARRDQIVSELENAGADMNAIKSSVVEKINSDPELLEVFKELIASEEEALEQLEKDGDRELVFLVTFFGEATAADVLNLEKQLKEHVEAQKIAIVRSMIHPQREEEDNSVRTTRIRLLIRAKYSELKVVRDEMNKEKKGGLVSRIQPLMAVRADVYLTVLKNMKNVDEPAQRILLASTTQFGAEDFLSLEELEVLTTSPQTILALDNECSELDEGCAKALLDEGRGIVSRDATGLPKLAAQNLKKLACSAMKATNQLKSVSEGNDVGISAESLVSQMSFTTELYAARVKKETKEVEKAALSTDEPAQYTAEDVKLLEKDVLERDVMATPSMLLTSVSTSEFELVEPADLSGQIDKTAADTALQAMKDQKVSPVIRALFEKLGGCGN